jgi:hypothetical protein
MTNIKEPSSPSPAPTTAPVRALSHWITFFHSTKGIYRHPSTEGVTIEHLDIDLRFIAIEEDEEPKKKSIRKSTFDGDDEPTTPMITHMPKQIQPIWLPSVCSLTLRGGEACQEDERMDILAEVLMAIRPVEVKWWGILLCSDLIGFVLLRPQKSS